MTIREFRTGLTWGFARPTPDAEEVMTPSWESKISIDLTWVAICQPYIAVEHRVGGPSLTCCWVVMAGSDRANGMYIDCTYEEFMPMWMEART